VKLNDVAFAVNALILTTIQILQCFIYKRGPNNVNSIFCMSFCTIGWLTVYVGALLAAIGIVIWLDYLYYLSYIKLTITFVKYVPQVYMNYKKKSTIGLSMFGVMLDFTGGVFSILQQIIDAINERSWLQITGDPTKLGLSLFSMFFDSCYLVQHYILYPDVREHLSWRSAWNQTVEANCFCSCFDPIRKYCLFTEPPVVLPYEQEQSDNIVSVTPIQSEKLNGIVDLSYQTKDSE